MMCVCVESLYSVRTGEQRDDDEKKERIASDAQRPMWRNKKGEKRRDLCGATCGLH
jgi:hypothetical protein